MDLETVAYIERQWDAVKRELGDHTGLMTRFISASGGLSRECVHPVNPSSSKTGTSFALHTLETSGLLNTAFSPDQRVALFKFIRETLFNSIGPITDPPETGKSEPEIIKPRDKNEYSVPIWLSAILVANDRPEAGFQTLSEPEREHVVDVVSSLAHMMKANGHLSRVAWGTTAPPAPSGYLTYWGTNALMLAHKSSIATQEIKRLTGEALVATARWAEAEMTRLIACHHAGLLSKFDVVECIATAGAASRLNRHLNTRPVDEVAQLVTHSMSIVLDYHFLASSFRLSRPVFTDISRNTVLCPTAEALAMLLSSLSAKELRDLLTRERMDKLFEAFLWCRRNRRINGYPPDFDTALNGAPEVNVFSTASTVAFCKLLSDQLDDAADTAARDALGTAPWMDVEVFNYPDPRLASVIKRKMIDPLTGNAPLSAAKYSMILHGPPGTAKTSIAARVATDLKWPLKTITQSDFLKSGMDKIDAEANRIFTLCLSLKNVVILFDELEELILSRDEVGVTTERESRLLTTSMLPKIHQLRDRKRVVFIFATNRLKQIDDAATRLGRFDILFGVDYPPSNVLVETARKALQSATALLAPEQKHQAELAFDKWTSWATSKSLHMTFKDAQYCAECLASAAEDGEANEALSKVIVAATEKIEKSYGERYTRFQALKQSDRL